MFYPGSNDWWLDPSAGRFDIGTAGPAAKLDVEGGVKIADGTQGAGKVLTSDANGLASWQTASGGAHGMQVFTSNGTWAWPGPSVTTVLVTMCGGGGGGGAPNIDEAGGGGASGYSYVDYAYAVSGSVNVTVGSGAEEGGRSSARTKVLTQALARRES